MYTFNNLIFGHNLNEINPELAEKFVEYDVSFRRKGTFDFQIEEPYHGGLVAGDPSNLILGFILTDNDNNKNYLKEFTEFKLKESELKIEYNKMLEKFYNENFDEETKELITEFKKSIEGKSPEFYEIEASS